MGRPKAVKDIVPTIASRGIAKKIEHKKFSEDDFDDEISEEEDVPSVPINVHASDDDSDDDAPEVISKEESLALYKLKEMHEQSMLMDSKARKLKKKQEKQALAIKRKSESVHLDADEELDMGLLEDISSKKVKLDQEAEEEERFRQDEEEEEEEEEENHYGSFNTRKIGKITIQVLPSGNGNKFEDQPDESLSILDNYKASSSALDFVNQMRAGQDRIKLSTKKAQKPKRGGKRR